MTDVAASAVLVRLESVVQKVVYYVSKRLVDAESRYLAIEKLTYCPVLASQKLRPYFQAHPIVVYTDQPLRQVIHKLVAAGRLLKWAIELSQFDIQYQPQTSIKGQALADFIAEFIEPVIHELVNTEPSIEAETPSWKLYVDGSSNDQRSEIGFIIISPDGHKFHNVVRFGFTASNNEVEYEALLVELHLAKSIQVKVIDIFNDSLLMANQISGEYQARGFKIMAYLGKVKDTLAQFDRYSIQQVPRDKNSDADTLARLASAKEPESLGAISVEYLPNPNIEKEETIIIQTAHT